MASVLHPDNDQTINPSQNTSICEVMDTFGGRRQFLQASLGTAAVAALGGWGKPLVAKPMEAVKARPAIGFASVVPNLASHFADQVTVPVGYTAKVLVAWGDAIGMPGPAANTHWQAALPMTEQRQLSTWGSHNDGMHFFPFSNRGSRGASDGLLVANHEYTDPGLVHATATYGTDPITQDRVATQLAAHGVSVVELRITGDGVQQNVALQRPSRYARRITGKTPCRISGPAAGHPLMRTAADPQGRRVLGTLGNCANGDTPWGTYLTCEENFHGYFGTSAQRLDKQPLSPMEQRYGINGKGFDCRWHEADARFDIRRHPHEPHRFGWVVEIDPFDPTSTPVKRTALGRFKHESATLTIGKDGSVAVYMGDDERNEYIYKFVSARRYRPRAAKANQHLLDKGTLYVAKFLPDGSGQWLPLVFGQSGLTPANGFRSQAEVLINTRGAADRAGATMMDRPEWAAVHPVTQEVYITLSNNKQRATVDAANPRPDNRFGHILRWKEAGQDVKATTFQWEIFVACGDKQSTQPHHQGNIIGDDLGAPDGLSFDAQGRLWIMTDHGGDGQGDWANIGGNVLACADPVSREIRRFMASPKGCEVTGMASTPDGRVMWVGIQHPGEGWQGSFTSKSTWPDSGVNGPTTQQAVIKPRSAVVTITKDDGGVIGT
jgi:uncharacterized protein